ncbi:flavoprotein [Ureibacillus manganicus]|uniref:flavoprotein n=1 Tax=Ureibacillus manganicus TaxID=1266064 RepID=UPI000AB948FC|nr:flavoprotein [Ureibacillus manganicus]
MTELGEFISKDYKGREVTSKGIVDFGYDESIQGWEQGFKFVEENNAEWNIKEIAVLPLKDDENLVILSATIDINGKSIGTSNLFFETFKKDNSTGGWKLNRSYVETGVLNENINNIQFIQTH